MLKIQKTIFAFVIVSTIFSSPLSALAAGDPSGNAMNKVFADAAGYLEKANAVKYSSIKNYDSLVGDTDGDGKVDSWEVPFEYNKFELERYGSSYVQGTQHTLSLFQAYQKLLNHYANATNFQAVIEESKVNIDRFLRGIKTLNNQIRIASEQSSQQDGGRVNVAGGAIVGMVAPTGALRIAAEKVALKSFVKLVSTDSAEIISRYYPRLTRDLFAASMGKGYGRYMSVNWNGVDKIINEADVYLYKDLVESAEVALKTAGAYTVENTTGKKIIAVGALLATISPVVQAAPSKTDVVMEALGVELGHFENATAAYYQLMKNSVTNIKVLQAQIDGFAKQRDAEVAAFSETLKIVKDLEKLQIPAELGPMGNN